MPAAGRRIAPETVQRTLRRTFGLSLLRDGQEQVIGRVLGGLSTLAVMPTGAGKSLCYQLPAVLIDGRTVVVSPLIALMKDQCDAANDIGIAAVETHSALAAAEALAAEQAIADGSARIIFATPERLAETGFQNLLQRHPRPIALLVIDEAHCISQWGHDFRPSFLEVGAARLALGKPPVLALTATATDSVVDDIAALLDIPRAGVVSTGTYRPNLRFRVEQVGREQDKLARTVALVKESGGSGLVYAATIKAATTVFEALAAAGESVGLYHGKLGAARRRDSQDAFMGDRVRVMVATNAFGLGIDKPDIRFVLHYQIPPGLDAYYQEAGRAGRDGDDAVCTLLFVGGDKAVQQFFLTGRYPDLADFEALVTTLGRAPATPVGWTADSAFEAAGRTRRKLMVVLSLLRQCGIVLRDAEGTLRLAQGDIDPGSLAAIEARYGEKRQRDRSMLERMVAYAQSGQCRWRLLLEHFEDAPDVARCEVCDNCLRLAEHEANARNAPRDESPEPAGEPPAHGFAVGERVRTRRHGTGRVIGADMLSVTVEFAEGVQRSFQPQFVAAVGSRTSRRPPLPVAAILT